MIEVIDVLDKVIKLGESLGAEEVFIYGKEHTVMSYEILVGNISSRISTTVGAQIIVSIGKRHGSSYTTDVSEEGLLRALSDAISIARASSEDPEWPGVPNFSEKYEEVKDVEYDIESASRAVQELYKSLLKDNRLVYNVGYEGTIEKTFIANSYGAEIITTEYENGLTAYLSVQTSQGASPGIWDYIVSKEQIVDSSALLENLEFLAKKAENLIKARDMTVPTIWHPSALMSILTYGFLPAVKGDAIHKKSSRYLEKFGENIFSKSLTIYDDPTRKDLVNYVPYDADGVRTKRIDIVKAGTLINSIWNYHWASLEGRETTGHATRDPRPGEYGINVHNISIEFGRRSLDDLISEISEGVYIVSLQGAHSTNPESGRFSVMANPAFYIKDGEIVGCLLGASITSSVDDVLNKFKEATSDYKEGFRSTLPWALIDNIRISSRV